jgi:hypothetical protein
MKGTLILLAVILAVAASTQAAAGQALTTADAKAWLGDWVLTIEGGRGPQERTLTIKDMGGKVVATLGGGRGGPIEIADVTKKGSDVVLKFKQQGRGGEQDVVMTLSLQGDGSVKVSQDVGGNARGGTGKKKA